MNDFEQFGQRQLEHLSLTDITRFGDHLFIEHAAIDAQHKEIFALGTQVYGDWRDGGSLDMLRPALEKLTNLVHAHFSFEERILSEINYEDLRGHAAEHRRMRDELSQMNDDFQKLREGREMRRGSLLNPGWSIMQFILQFAIGHVASCDMGYNRALIASRSQLTKGA